METMSELEEATAVQQSQKRQQISETVKPAGSRSRSDGDLFWLEKRRRSSCLPSEESPDLQAVKLEPMAVEPDPVVYTPELLVVTGDGLTGAREDRREGGGAFIGGAASAELRVASRRRSQSEVAVSRGGAHRGEETVEKKVEAEGGEEGLVLSAWRLHPEGENGGVWRIFKPDRFGVEGMTGFLHGIGVNQSLRRRLAEEGRRWW